MMLSNGLDISEDLVCMKQGVKEKTKQNSVFKEKKIEEKTKEFPNHTLIVKLIIDN